MVGHLVNLNSLMLYDLNGNLMIDFNRFFLEAYQTVVIN